MTMAARENLYAGAPNYNFYDKVVREQVALEIEDLAEGNSLTVDMQVAYRHAARAVRAQIKDDF